MGRIIIIGLDGVPFELLQQLAEKNVMPATKELMRSGIFKKVQSSIPEISSVAWSSIITGENPGEHGIFGFIDLFPNSYDFKFPNFNDLKCEPFWNDFNGNSVIINVPATYPVKPMRCVHISGFVSIDLRKSVFPSSLLPMLRDTDYRLDVDSEKAQDSMDSFLSDMDKTIKGRILASRYLWKNINWDVFMLVFTSTDRLMHFLWDAYEDSEHEYHKNFLEYFKKIDEAIGEIAENMGNEDCLLMISDHGFEKLQKEIYVNYLFRKHGFLKFEDNENAVLTGIASGTTAFALDPARIYVNLKGKFPSGSVSEKEKEMVLRDLESLFDEEEIDNMKIFKKTYRKEEIYSGPFMDMAPDLVLSGNCGFNLRASLKTDALTKKTIFTGKHTQENAFLLFNSKGIPISEFSFDQLYVRNFRSILNKAARSLNLPSLSRTD